MKLHRNAPAFATCGTALLILACDGAARTRQPILIAAETSLNEVHIEPSPSDRESVSANLHSLAEVLIGRSIDRSTALRTFEANFDRERQLPHNAALDGDASVAVGFDRSCRFWATNGRVTGNLSPDTPDVGESVARSTFLDTVQELASRSLIVPGDYDLNRARVRYVVAGFGKAPQVEKEWRKEYLFYAPRTIGGVEVHERQIRISVHRNGQLARLAIDVPVVIPESSVPRAALDSKLVDERVSREFSTYTVLSAATRYVFKTGGRIAPRRVFKIAPLLKTDDGVKRYGRAIEVYYSLLDLTEPPESWLPSSPADLQSDVKPIVP